MPADVAVTREILQRCRALGFALAGVASVEPTQYESELRAWLGAGRHGEMDYLARYADLLVDPAGLLDGAQSIICVADRYALGTPDAARDEGGAEGAPAVGRIARYARGDDYHRVIKRRLHELCDELRARFPDASFLACVDTAPLLEREYAARAGLGAIGKHTLLIDRGIGSYLLLGEIVTTLVLSPEPPVEPVPSDPCGACTRCIDACPTGAISPWSVDATRCISYLTIEHRSPIDPTFAEATGDWLFGCDVCQEVCPHNQLTERTNEATIEPAYTPRRAALELAEVLAWTEDDRRAAFTRSPMKRAKLSMMKRNALIVAGNTLAQREDPKLRAAVERIARSNDEPEMVQDTARRALMRR